MPKVQKQPATHLNVVKPSAPALPPVVEPAFDPKTRPVWEIIEEIGAAVPAGEWDKVPADGAQNLEHYLNGHAKKKG